MDQWSTYPERLESLNDCLREFIEDTIPDWFASLCDWARTLPNFVGWLACLWITIVLLCFTLAASDHGAARLREPQNSSLRIFYTTWSDYLFVPLVQLITSILEYIVYALDWFADWLVDPLTRPRRAARIKAEKKLSAKYQILKTKYDEANARADQDSAIIRKLDHQLTTCDTDVSERDDQIERLQSENKRLVDTKEEEIDSRTRHLQEKVDKLEEQVKYFNDSVPPDGFPLGTDLKGLELRIRKWSSTNYTLRMDVSSYRRKFEQAHDAKTRLEEDNKKLHYELSQSRTDCRTLDEQHNMLNEYHEGLHRLYRELRKELWITRGCRPSEADRDLFSLGLSPTRTLALPPTSQHQPKAGQQPQERVRSGHQDEQGIPEPASLSPAAPSQPKAHSFERDTTQPGRLADHEQATSQAQAPLAGIYSTAQKLAPKDERSLSHGEKTSSALDECTTENDTAPRDVEQPESIPNIAEQTQVIRTDSIYDFPPQTEAGGDVATHPISNPETPRESFIHGQEAAAEYRERFPNGHKILLTPAQDLQCSLYALQLSCQSQTEGNVSMDIGLLRDCFAQAFPNQVASNLEDSQVAMTLYKWGQVYGLYCQLGIVKDGCESYILRAEDHPGQKWETLWIHNDDAEAYGVKYSHWSGLEPIRAPEPQHAPEQMPGDVHVDRDTAQASEAQRIPDEAQENVSTTNQAPQSAEPLPTQSVQASTQNVLPISTRPVVDQPPLSQPPFEHVEAQQAALPATVPSRPRTPTTNKHPSTPPGSQASSHSAQSKMSVDSDPESSPPRSQFGPPLPPPSEIAPETIMTDNDPAAAPAASPATLEKSLPRGMGDTIKKGPSQIIPVMLPPSAPFPRFGSATAPVPGLKTNYHDPDGMDETEDVPIGDPSKGQTTPSPPARPLGPAPIGLLPNRSGGVLPQQPARPSRSSDTKDKPASIYGKYADMTPPTSPKPALPHIPGQAPTPSINVGRRSGPPSDVSNESTISSATPSELGAAPDNGNSEYRQAGNVATQPNPYQIPGLDYSGSQTNVSPFGQLQPSGGVFQNPNALPGQFIPSGEFDAPGEQVTGTEEEVVDEDMRDVDNDRGGDDQNNENNYDPFAPCPQDDDKVDYGDVASDEGTEGEGGMTGDPVKRDPPTSRSGDHDDTQFNPYYPTPPTQYPPSQPIPTTSPPYTVNPRDTLIDPGPLVTNERDDEEVEMEDPDEEEENQDGDSDDEETNKAQERYNDKRKLERTLGKLIAYIEAQTNKQVKLERDKHQIDIANEKMKELEKQQEDLEEVREFFEDDYNYTFRGSNVTDEWDEVLEEIKYEAGRRMASSLEAQAETVRRDSQEINQRYGLTSDFSGRAGGGGPGAGDDAGNHAERGEGGDANDGDGGDGRQRRPEDEIEVQAIQTIATQIERVGSPTAVKRRRAIDDAGYDSPRSARPSTPATPSDANQVAGPRIVETRADPGAPQTPDQNGNALEQARYRWFMQRQAQAEQEYLTAEIDRATRDYDNNGRTQTQRARILAAQEMHNMARENEIQLIEDRTKHHDAANFPDLQLPGGEPVIFEEGMKAALNHKTREKLSELVGTLLPRDDGEGGGGDGGGGGGARYSLAGLTGVTNDGGDPPGSTDQEGAGDNQESLQENQKKDNEDAEAGKWSTTTQVETTKTGTKRRRDSDDDANNVVSNNTPGDGPQHYITPYRPHPPPPPTQDQIADPRRLIYSATNPRIPLPPDNSPSAAPIERARYRWFKQLEAQARQSYLRDYLVRATKNYEAAGQREELRQHVVVAQEMLDEAHQIEVQFMQERMLTGRGDFNEFPELTLREQPVVVAAVVKKEIRRRVEKGMRKSKGGGEHG